MYFWGRIQDFVTAKECAFFKTANKRRDAPKTLEHVNKHDSVFADLGEDPG